MKTIKDHEDFRIFIGIVKGEPFHWKPVWCRTKRSFHKLENGKDFKWINTWSYYIPVTVRVFWLWWCLGISIKPKNIGGKIPQRYVKYENTHLAPMEYPHGSWRD